MRKNQKNEWGGKNGRYYNLALGDNGATVEKFRAWRLSMLVKGMIVSVSSIKTLKLAKQIAWQLEGLDGLNVVTAEEKARSFLKAFSMAYGGGNMVVKKGKSKHGRSVK